MCPIEAGSAREGTSQDYACASGFNRGVNERNDGGILFSRAVTKAIVAGMEGWADAEQRARVQLVPQPIMRAEQPDYATGRPIAARSFFLYAERV